LYLKPMKKRLAGITAMEITINIKKQASLKKTKDIKLKMK